MRWLQRYQERQVTSDEAVKVIHSNSRVTLQPGCAVPMELMRAMTRHGKNVKNVEVAHILTMGEAPYMDKEFEGIFRHRALFVGHNARKAVAEGRADAMAIHLSQVPKLFSNGILPIDVVMVHVSPPDEHGFCSFGTDVGTIKAAAEAAKVVIAQINPQMPRALGDCFIHVNKIDQFVVFDEPLQEMPQFVFDPEDPKTVVPMTIGEKIVDLIDDGSTLQMGIGTIPDAVLYHLRDKRDLGIHSEMFSDGVVDLVEDGIINGEKKTINRGKIVAGFVLGTKKTFDFIDNNPVAEFRPTEYVNDLNIIAQHDNMIAINSAIEVDITGQVCADSIGPRIFSGFGGQVDFIRGAAVSKGGKPIIALPSTTKGDSISRIVPQLKPGAGVVTTRADVHWVVTEFGAVNLFGMSYRDRVKKMISISHPNFREDLERYAKEQKYI
jgi:4-hydroxybutyrate CoA-transferase